MESDSKTLIVKIIGEAEMSEDSLQNAVSGALMSVGCKVRVRHEDGHCSLSSPSGPVYQEASIERIRPEHGGDECVVCGARYSIPLMPSQALWEKILHPAHGPDQRMCPTCVVTRSAAVNDWQTTWLGGGIDNG